MLCPRADGARTVPARCGERVRVQVPEPPRAPAAAPSCRAATASAPASRP